MARAVTCTAPRVRGGGSILRLWRMPWTVCRSKARWALRDLREEAGGRGSPAIQVRFSRFRGTVQQGPVQRQETQIVQSCTTLDDFLPGFRPQAIRPRNVEHCALARGCCAPLRSPRKPPLRHRSRSGSSPASAWPNDQAASRRMFSPPTTDHRRSRPSMSRVSLRRDRRRRGRRCHRFGAGPPGLRDGLRPSLPPGSSPLPNPAKPGRARRDAPATCAGRGDIGGWLGRARNRCLPHAGYRIGLWRWSSTSTTPPLFCLASVGRWARNSGFPGKIEGYVATCSTT